MPSTRWVEVSLRLSVAGALALAVTMGPVSAQARRSCADIEAFMRSAKTTVLRGEIAVMDDGAAQHRVFIHTDDGVVVPGRYRDSWKANVAAYELAKILEINIIPPYVEVTVNGTSASASWVWMI
jgi:hypothetical protein